MCLCQLCILDTLICHCQLCVKNEFLFKNYPSNQCIYLKQWNKHLLNFINSEMLAFSNVCCCRLHNCLFNFTPCYCTKCSFKIAGCVCIRCSAYSVTEDITCKHLPTKDKCKEEIVSNWLNHIYNELFKKFYPNYSDNQLSTPLLPFSSTFPPPIDVQFGS